MKTPEGPSEGEAKVFFFLINIFLCSEKAEGWEMRTRNKFRFKKKDGATADSRLFFFLFRVRCWFWRKTKMNENPLKKKSEIFTKFHDVELGFLRFYRVLPGFTGFSWAVPSFIRFCWTWLVFEWVLPELSWLSRVLIRWFKSKIIQAYIIWN